MYGIYAVTYRDSGGVAWKAEVVIGDNLYSRARRRDSGARERIISRFVQKRMHVHGSAPSEAISWEDPNFTIRLLRNASMPAPHGKLTKRLVCTKSVSVRQLSPVPMLVQPGLICSCDDDCPMCAIGDHAWCSECVRQF